MVLVAVFVTAVAIVGCEWGSVTDDVSGSGGGGGGGGTNNGTGGGTVTNVVPGGTTNVISENETAVYNEALMVGEAGRTTYSGHVANVPVVPGSMRVRAGGFYFVDDGGGVLAGSSAGTAGTINYASGSWSIDLGGKDIAAGETILANYIYQTSSTP